MVAFDMRGYGQSEAPKVSLPAVHHIYMEHVIGSDEMVKYICGERKDKIIEISHVTSLQFFVCLLLAEF